jgi:hypothetical protein
MATAWLLTLPQASLKWLAIAPVNRFPSFSTATEGRNQCKLNFGAAFCRSGGLARLQQANARDALRRLNAEPSSRETSLCVF